MEIPVSKYVIKRSLVELKQLLLEIKKQYFPLKIQFMNPVLASFNHKPLDEEASVVFLSYYNSLKVFYLFSNSVLCI